MNIELEWKSNSFQNWKAYRQIGKVLFETRSNVNNNTIGKNLFTSGSKLWAHSFWDATDTKIIEVLVYLTAELRAYLTPRIHRYYMSTTPNLINGVKKYETEWILVPALEIRRFLFKHYVTMEYTFVK